MPNTIPGTGQRVRSPLTNAQDVGRKYDGTSLSPKALSDLRGVGVAKAVAPAANGVLTLPVPITEVVYIASFTTASGAATPTGAGLVEYPLEGTHFTIVKKNSDGVGEVREAAGTDWSAQTWLIHYRPDAEDVDIPQAERSSVFNPLPLA